MAVLVPHRDKTSGSPACNALPHSPVTGTTGQKHPSTVQGEFIMALADSFINWNTVRASITVAPLSSKM